MRAERLTRYPGSVTGWENPRFPGTTSFVVELPRAPCPPQRVGVFTPRDSQLTHSLLLASGGQSRSHDPIQEQTLAPLAVASLHLIGGRRGLRGEQAPRLLVARPAAAALGHADQLERRRRPRRPRTEIITAAAATTSPRPPRISAISQADLLTPLQSGKTLAQVAGATSGKSVAGLIDALVAAEKTELAAAVTAGRLTQAQADQITTDV